MKYNYLDTWDIKHIISITNDPDLLLDTIDDMLSNIADTAFREGYGEGYDQGRIDDEDYNEIFTHENTYDPLMDREYNI